MAGRIRVACHYPPETNIVHRSKNRICYSEETDIFALYGRPASRPLRQRNSNHAGFGKASALRADASFRVYYKEK
jgi:hypothetical protein